jgi:replicative DNA helicase
MSAVLSAVDDYGQDRQIAQLRIPPHSIEGESSVLGGLLLDNDAWAIFIAMSTNLYTQRLGR